MILNDYFTGLCFGFNLSNTVEQEALITALPVCLLPTRITSFSSRHGNDRSSPSTVRHTSNSYGTLNVTCPLAVTIAITFHIIIQ